MSRLAIEGGTPVRTRPFGPWPHVEDADVVRAASVLQSGRLNYWTGERGQKFERELSAYVGAEHGIALANGTVALELALCALGIGPGDDVVVPARTFIATASAVVARGARPVVADVDRDSGNITVGTVADAMTELTAAIIPVHLAGWPCDVPALSRAYEGIPIIEDCAQSIGATIDGKQTGSLGVCGAFSFCQDKIVTTAGEGGAIVTSDRDLWQRGWSYKDHGKSYDKTRGSRTDSPTVSFQWVHDSFGTNWRMTEMQAELGCASLERLDGWLQQRRFNAAVLCNALADTPGIRVPAVPQNISHAYYKFYVYAVPELLVEGWDRDRLIQAIRSEGIPCSQGICPEIYKERCFADAGLGPREELPVAAELGRTAIMFMVHPTLDERDMADTAEAVNKVMERATATS